MINVAMTLKNFNASNAESDSPLLVKAMLTAKQRYSSHTLAKNLHKHTKLQIAQQYTYKLHPQLYRKDIVQLLSQSSQGAAAWLTLPPSVMCILEAPSEQDPRLWVIAYQIWAGAPPLSLTSAKLGT